MWLECFFNFIIIALKAFRIPSRSYARIIIGRPPSPASYYHNHQKIEFQRNAILRITIYLVTDDLCFLEEGNNIREGMMDDYDKRIRDKWLHCLECGPCVIRFSMVQMDDIVRAIDMRVMIVEFFKAIGETALLTQEYLRIIKT